MKTSNIEIHVCSAVSLVMPIVVPYTDDETITLRSGMIGIVCDISRQSYNVRFKSDTIDETFWLDEHMIELVQTSSTRKKTPLNSENNASLHRATECNNGVDGNVTNTQEVPQHVCPLVKEFLKTNPHIGPATESDSHDSVDEHPLYDGTNIIVHDLGTQRDLHIMHADYSISVCADIDNRLPIRPETPTGDSRYFNLTDINIPDINNSAYGVSLVAYYDGTIKIFNVRGMTPKPMLLISKPHYGQGGIYITKDKVIINRIIDGVTTITVLDIGSMEIILKDVEI